MAYDTWGGSWGNSWLLSWTRADTPPPTPDNGWLGGPTDYAVRKRHLEELDRIDEKIRKDRIREALELLSDTPELPVETPEIRKIDRQFLSDLKEIEVYRLNIKALQAEIALIREYLLAQQLFEEAMLREQTLDDDMTFLLMLQ